MSSAEQINFLLACIKHTSSGGKIDFQEVANELSINTKQAAAKRYERLKKRAQTADLSGGSNGAGDDDAGDDKPAAKVANPPRTPKKPRATPRKASAQDTPGSVAATPTSAKRKRITKSTEKAVSEDDEAMSDVRSEITDVKFELKEEDTERD